MDTANIFANDHRVLALRDMRARPSSADLDTHPPEIVVGIALCNQAKHIAQCLRSVFSQQIDPDRLAILILNDCSEDNWEDAAKEFLPNPRILIVDANCGSPANSRNAILDFVDMNMPSVRWVARLDADDCFSCPNSLEAAVDLGYCRHAGFVIGGNRLRLPSGQYCERSNPASFDLLNPEWIITRLSEMANGSAVNELPSCNLLLAARTGWRYPDMQSAEDHALVTDLLINHPKRGAVLTEPFYSDYTLQGEVTRDNVNTKHYAEARDALLRTALVWLKSRSLPGELLGYGREGIVKKVGTVVEKRFYSGKPTREKVDWLRKVLAGPSTYLPVTEWYQDGADWCCRYSFSPTTEAGRISYNEARGFLLECLCKNIVCLNIKTCNFRRTSEGALLFVDVGNDIVPMNVDFFLDSAARLYTISKLEWLDDELRRRKHGPKTEDTLNGIHGFKDFYRDLLTEHATRQWKIREVPVVDTIATGFSSVTLMVKACAMDSQTLIPQVRSIVHNLEIPRRFRERILLIDPYRGPFLRQHNTGNYDELIENAKALKELGVIDRILVAPADQTKIAETNMQWFGISTPCSHSTQDVPITPQLWGFDQVETRYVLQCDSDVLIGRHDFEHDYLAEMLSATQPDDVLGIAFNIPHSPDLEFRPYDAPKGEYVPEVRCGLLDLHRMRSCRPLPNNLQNGRLSLSWYRSLQTYQRQYGLRTLRGGDHRTFYIHPKNTQKQDPLRLSIIRDLTGQARVPTYQYANWDLDNTGEGWCYAHRSELVVFLSKGRNTHPDRLQRFVSSLMMQDDQRFGLIVIDDASDDQSPYVLPHLLKPLEHRTTLIRHAHHQGRIPNLILAITKICTNPDTLIVILDLDDALMDASAVRRLHVEIDKGHDVILASMFRPDKPIKTYHPNFIAPRDNWGGEVWVHLRSFKKRLFDAIPHDDLKLDGTWIEHCTDYATMIPIVERCHFPMYIPEYFYFHERSTPKTPELQARKDTIIRSVLFRHRYQADPLSNFCL